MVNLGSFMKRNLLIICLCLVNIFQSNSLGSVNGLLFNSSAQPISKRSSLSFFEHRLEPFKNQFDISFDVSIWDMKHFGFVLRVINEANQEVDLAFVNFGGEDDLYLDFHSPITHRSVEIPFDKKNIFEKKWMSVKISFNLKDNFAEVNFKDSVYRCEKIGLKNPSRLKFVYGLWGLNLDVPYMAIRNIRIFKEEKLKYNIPLNQSDGLDVTDDKGRKLGLAKNPDWIINHHHYWEKKAVFSSDVASGIAYDEQNQRILFVDGKYLWSYDPRDNKKEIISKIKLPEYLLSGYLIAASDGRMLFYHTDTIASTEVFSMAVSNVESDSVDYYSGVLGKKLSHHNSFFSKSNQELYVFGGQGNHQFSNAFYRYELNNSVWNKVEFKGDKIIPRYRAAIGKGVNPESVLVMGGYGNETGKQEHGGKQLYDLYEVDLKQKQIKKIWDIRKHESGFVPCSDLILNNDKTHFYTLCNFFQESGEFIQLCKFSLEDGSYEVVSDTIRIRPFEEKTTINLFYSELMDEFYATVRELVQGDNLELRVYSLKAPPVSLKMLSDLSTVNKFTLGNIVLIVVLFILITGGVLLFIRKRVITKRDNLDFTDNLINENKITPDKNAVYVFGEFQVFDRTGKDISYRFSTKLRSLFALILFYSTPQSKGISTEKLTLDLWPERDMNSSKNTRGVTINRLRAVLEDIDGIELAFKNSKWVFEMSEPFYCDLTEYFSLLPISFDNEELLEKMPALYSILTRGLLFPGVQEVWIDVFKREQEEVLEKLLRMYITLLYDRKRFAQVVAYADLILQIDPTNEDVVNLSILSLQKMKKGKKALMVYKHFVANYLVSMGSKPKVKTPERE